MSHIHWVARQNKLEIPNDEEEVNTREIHKCDGQAYDPDTMVVPLTPKPTRTLGCSWNWNFIVHPPPFNFFFFSSRVDSSFSKC
jgi:hypothetical protein